MRPEKHNLIRALADEEAAARRDAIVRSSGRILRRRRWQRQAFRGVAIIAVVALATISIQKTTTPKSRVLTVATPPREEMHQLTDAELLAMFPDTPVGLMTLKNGKKRLIFPRPEDAKRYMAQY